MNGDDAAARFRVGQADVEALEPARAQQRPVDDLQPVGSTDDEHLDVGPESIHLGEDLGDHRVASAAAAVVGGAATGRDGVELVEYDDRGGVPAGLGEKLPDLALALADILVGDLGPGHYLDRRVHARSEEHTSELQSPCNLVCRLLLEKKKK